MAYKTPGELLVGLITNLRAETVQSTTLSLERIHNVKSSDGLSAGVLSVGHGILNDGFQEDLEDTAGLLVDQTTDTLHTTTTSETSDGGLGDTLNVITKNLSVPLSTTLSETLTTLTTAGHY